MRWNTNPDTPLPPDVPAGENPPDGASINYYLGQNVSGPVTLELRDAKGQTVRRYSSADPAPPVPNDLNIPTYWVRPPQVLSAEHEAHATAYACAAGAGRRAGRLRAPAAVGRASRLSWRGKLLQRTVFIQVQDALEGPRRLDPGNGPEVQYTKRRLALPSAKRAKRGSGTASVRASHRTPVCLKRGRPTPTKKSCQSVSERAAQRV